MEKFILRDDNYVLKFNFNNGKKIYLNLLYLKNSTYYYKANKIINDFSSKYCRL
ncbi:Uncharacterized protein Nst1_490 [Candidatus Nanobsidianus stetteri]|uniref:Uncharacterized protein n=1 Tax=Nanobsidianus stetteri TaxID=1294122 RepID=R1E4L5_NANST|nr:Uncharacterized protein Nst1_490 [Candidatus Nanobsidianus stetteri]